MHEPLAYRQGRFLPQSQAGLSLHDAGFVQGVTVTDLVRTFRQQPYLLPDHLARFCRSCRLARIPLDLDESSLETAARNLLAHNLQGIGSHEELGLVLFATPGPIGWYLGEAMNGPATLGMHTFPLPFPRYRNWLTQGVRLRIPQIRQFPAEAIDRQIKHRSRLFWWLADQEVRAIDPAAQALLLDADGSVTETAAANLLFVRQGRVLCPPEDRVLGGISLQVVEGICRRLGIPFERTLLFPADCAQAEEALLTCTSFCLSPVARLEDHDYPIDRPVFERLLAAWSADVGVDIRGQILAESSNG